MAGVKISKLKTYDEVFQDNAFDEFVNDMIVPVSLGNKTISVKIRELTHYINLINSERIDAQDELIENQNTQIEIQNTQIETQNELIENQNTEIEKQNEKLENQDNIISENSEFISQLSQEITVRVNEIIALSESDRNEFASIKSSVNDEHIKNQEQDELISNNTNLILNNKELIEKLSESIAEEILKMKEDAEATHDEMKEIIDENEKITALALIDLNQTTGEIMININSLKESSEEIHEQMKQEQKEIDESQNERIETIEDNISIWEIYGE